VGEPTAIISPFGQKTTLAVNIEGTLQSTMNPAGEKISLEYGTSGLLTKITDPLGRLSQYSYDALGHLILAEDAAGGSQALARYETNDGFEITRTTAMGRASTYAVSFKQDGELNVVNTDPVGAQTTLTTRPDDDLSYTFPDGMKVTSRFNGEPRFGTQSYFTTKQDIVTPDGITSRVTQSRTVTQANAGDPLSLLTEKTEIDINGRIYSVLTDTTTMTTIATTPQGRTTVRTFDEMGRITSLKSDPLLDSLTTTFDSFGRVMRQEHGIQSTEFTYDTLGNLTASENALGEKTKLELDKANRQTAFILPSGRTYRFGYDSSGNLLSIEMPNGALHELAYNEINEFINYTPAGNVNPLESEFNIDRQRVKSTQPGGRQTQYLIDLATGRDTGISYPEADVSFTYFDASNRVGTVSRTPTDAQPGQSLSYSYDGSLLTGVNFSGVAIGEYDYSYDSNFRVISRSFTNGTERAFSYDDDDLLTGIGDFAISRTGPAGLPGELGDGVLAVNYEFNSRGRLANRSHKILAAGVYNLALTHDAAGRISQKVETIDGLITTYDYTYDLDGQLLEVHLEDVLEEHYEYDVNGNRTVREVSGVTETTTYDTQDRILSHNGIAYVFDDDGFLTQLGTFMFSYSARGELLKVLVSPGNEIRYTYDGFGRRVARTDSNGTTQYLYGNPGNQLLITEIIDQNGTLSQYFYDESAALIAMDRDGVRYYLATDQVGSPRVITDSSGAIVKRLVYDTWGVLIQDNNPSFNLPFGFAGGLADEVTGLVRFGMRDYDPRVGRWMARDPVLYEGGQANLFVYANNDPVNYRDPTGLFCIGGSVFSGFGIGATLCMADGHFSLCGELGIGLGGGFSIDPFGEAASAADAYYTKVEVGGACGPLTAGFSAKLNSCGKYKINCPVGIKPFGNAGKILKNLAHDPCSGKMFSKTSIDPFGGNFIKSNSKEVSPGGKVKCKVGANIMGGGCLTTKT